MIRSNRSIPILLVALVAASMLPVIVAGTASAVAPSFPGCTSHTQTFSNTTPVPIPDVAVATSTIDVAGEGVVLDVDAQTFIQHTFDADLDVTLTSPAGTVVTLTTDNGAGLDNAFNGTVWDDSADPDGQVPYTTNAGLATDHPYVNGTTASPLVPEEAMGAFIGEDPNGTWTLRISDDLAGDTGTLQSWALAVTLSGIESGPVATFSETTPTVISDLAVVTSTIEVSDNAPLADLNVQTFIQHTFAADLDVTLTSPAGTVVTLTTDNGSGNNNVFGTVWDDSADPDGQVPYTTNAGLVTDHPYSNGVAATPLVPEEAMGAFIGEDPSGTWTLTISDDLAGDTGTLQSWSLDLSAGACAPPGGPGPSPTPSPTPPPPGTQTFDLNVVKVGHGRVTSDPGGINCGRGCDATFDAGTAVTLTARPRAGWTLARWRFGCKGAGLVCAITLDTDQRARAVFVRV